MQTNTMWSMPLAFGCGSATEVGDGRAAAALPAAAPTAPAAEAASSWRRVRGDTSDLPDPRKPSETNNSGRGEQKQQSQWRRGWPARRGERAAGQRVAFTGRRTASSRRTTGRAPAEHVAAERLQAGSTCEPEMTLAVRAA